MPDERKTILLKRLVVLVSGKGSNLRAIIDAVSTKRINAIVTHVISDRANAGGLKIAQAAGVPVSVAETEETLRTRLTELAPDGIALAGFMRVLAPETVRHFSGKILNIHPSLLPRHKGLHTHRRVIEHGDKYHGCSVHFATEKLDAGPIALQARIRVNKSDSPDTLAARVLKYEHIIYPQALSWYCDGRLRMQNGQCVFDNHVLETPRLWMAKER